MRQSGVLRQQTLTISQRRKFRRDFHHGFWSNPAMHSQLAERDPGSVCGVPPVIPDCELFGCIGRGSYGDVWLARSVTGAWRAVKIVYRRSGEQTKAFEREFRGIQNYEPISRADDSLMDVLHVGQNQQAGFFHYVMELADDANAECGMENVESGARPASSASFKSRDQLPEDVVPRQGSAGASPSRVTSFDPHSYQPRTLKLDLVHRGRLPFTECVDLGLALTAALKVLHSHRLVHRDIKPTNVIYVKGQPKLSDIGLVAVSEATVSLVGTIGYVAPEGPGRAQADLYSLGKVLYEASTGKDRQEFPEPVTELKSGESLGLWAEFNEVLLKACADNPAKRYSSAEQMRSELELLKGGKSLKRLRLLERRVKLALVVVVGMISLAGAGYITQRMRLAAAHVRAESAEALTKESDRQLAIQRIQAIRLNPHYDGWSDEAWKSSANAASVRLNNQLLSHAVGCLVGLDAHISRKLTSFSAVSAVFDLSGKEVLLGRLTNGPAAWNLETGAMIEVGASEPSGSYVSNNKMWARPGKRSVWLFRGIKRSNPPEEYRFFDEENGENLSYKMRRPVVFSSDGSTMAACADLTNSSRVVAVWSLDARKRLLAREMLATALALTPDGSLLAAARTDGIISVWNLPEGEEVARLKAGRPTIHTLVFQRDPHVYLTPSGEISPHWWLAAGESGGKVTIWDLAQQLPKANLRRSYYDVFELAFNSDGTLLATGGRGDVKIWDVAHENVVLQLRISDGVTALAFAPDDRQLLVCTSNTQWQEVFLWDLEYGRGMRTLQGLSGQISKLCLSPNEHFLAALSHDWEIAVWELPSGRLREIFHAAESDTTADNAAMAFSPDGQQLAFAAGTNAVLWSLSAGRRLVSWTLPEALADVMGFHRTGKLLLFRNEFQGWESGAAAGTHGVRHHPVVRIRELLASGGLRLIAEATNLAGRVFTSVAPWDADFFAFESTFWEGGHRVRQVKVLDGITGAELWSRSLTNQSEYAELRIDPFGQVLAFTTKYQNFAEAHLVEARSGRFLRSISGFSSSFGPNAEWRVARGLDFQNEGYSVRTIPDDTLVLSLGPDFELSVLSLISRGGSLLVWTNPDATVIVCDLPQIRERLASLKINQTHQ
ncbi:MAG: protein kinase [Verrucomicrobiales bacterium]|nr:protein kinase [Verrucomicrobiales bacterium]